MNVIIPQQQLNFLLEVLKDIYQSGGDRSRVYQRLQANLDLLDDRLVKLLRSWGTHRLMAVKPTAAFVLAQTALEFSQLVEQFPQGNKQTNLEIAIAGYETALLVFTPQVYPQDFANVQVALTRAKQQRQDEIERQTINRSVARITGEIEVVQATLKTLRTQLETLKTSPTKIDIAPLISAIRELHPPQDELKITGIKLPPEEFNTAILYDIENLTKGYNFDRELLARISLDKVISDIRKQHQFGKIAIQRAYANWSIPQLKNMRYELLALGIDPIQVFGFGLYSQKNAADIQLTIDAIELIHNRPAIQLFIIVSGDGAFASVANKLHEYGKQVIGCAYEQATNYFLEAVCDGFISIPDPEIKLNNMPISISSSKDKKIANAQKILLWLARHQDYGKQLRDKGMYLGEVAKIFQQKLKYFNYKSLGFDKWKPCLEFLCQGTNFCLIDKGDTEQRLILKETAILGSDSLGNSHISQRSDSNHSLTKYRKILSSGYPIFRMPPPEDLVKVANSLAESRFVREKIGEGIEKITRTLDPQISQQSVKKSLLVSISAGCFITEPEGASLPDMSLTLKPECYSKNAILGTIKDRARQKLEQHIKEVDDELLKQLIPAA